ncbi:MAG: nucleotidyltransferase domain-containing protein [Bacteroidetes bacterium]|nr:MAG: nucleotidyltransferase domain-containing protein [Bacteroidota bacterium]
MNIVERNIDLLIVLCKNHKVSELYIFGSILSDKFSNKSDIDFLVQFEKIDILEYFDNYMDFKENLEKLLDRPVDLLENQAIRNPVFRKVVDRDKKLVYERESA